MQLVNGSRIIIVGGGPAGSFTALHLLRMAAEKGLSLNVTILEPRDFSLPGPGGCNKCAGILSSNLVNNLESMGLRIPPAVIQSEIITYILNFNRFKFSIHRPDPSQRIFSVYRGGGPRLGEPPPMQSFDGWLLEQARTNGANIQRVRVQKILPASKPIVVTAHQKFEADLVVLATGVNTKPPLDPDWGYKPPHTEIMAQDELPLPVDLPENSVSVYFDNPSGLIFGAVIPKGRYVNISLLGHKMPVDAISAFLESNDLLKIIPMGIPGLCGCTPRVAVSSASNFHADRLVVVGDAAVTRLYKDGIGAAFLTSQAAARTAIQQGVSRPDFTSGYFPVCKHIATDNQYGHWLFRLWSLNRRSPFLINAWQRAIQAEASMPPKARVHTRVLWGMFTGSESYRHLLWLAISRHAFSGMWKGARLSWRNRKKTD